MTSQNYYTVRDKAIELGIIKVSEIDGSHSFNASPDKLYALVLSFADCNAICGLIKRGLHRCKPRLNWW